MSAGRVHWRDSLMTWPGLSVTLVLLPWQWSLRFWNDWDMTSSWSMWLGPVRVEWFANKPLFTLERVEPVPAPVERRFGCWDGACSIKTIHWKRDPGCIRLDDPVVTPSQTSTAVDGLPADRAASPTAPSRSSGAGSSSSPSVAPTDSLPDAKGHPKP